MYHKAGTCLYLNSGTLCVQIMKIHDAHFHLEMSSEAALCVEV